MVLFSLYVTDSYNHRVQKFSSNGGFITKWGIEGSNIGQFDRPTGVAVDSSGNVYVTDYRNDCVQKFNSAGGFIAKWGTAGSISTQFQGPRSIAVNVYTGNVYVADSGNDRIQKFNSAGGFITVWGRLAGVGSVARLRGEHSVMHRLVDPLATQISSPLLLYCATRSE